MPCSNHTVFWLLRDKHTIAYVVILNHLYAKFAMSIDTATETVLSLTEAAKVAAGGPRVLNQPAFSGRDSTMPEPNRSRRDFLAIAALNPDDNATCEVFVSYDRMQAVGRRSMGHAKECGYTVPEILQHPTAVFEGLRRDEDEDRGAGGWRCYCGVPSHAYRTDGTATRPYPEQVYLVFVNDEGVVYNWRWERANPEDPLLPVDHLTRFKKRLL